MNFQLFDEETVNEILEVLAQLIDWNSLDIFSSCIDIFKDFLNVNLYKVNPMKCLHAVVHKGMDYYLKVELLANL